MIDSHAHIFPPVFRQRREDYIKRDLTFASLFSNPGARMATAEELVAAMDEAEIEQAVVMGIGWTDASTAGEANDYILEAQERYPKRLVAFCSVNPAWGEAALRAVERCAAAGARGVGELHPDTQGFDIADRGVMAPLMEAALGLGLVVLTHTSEPVGHLYPGKGGTTPDKAYAFVSNFPENTIVCAHWGGGLAFYALMPEVAEALSNVYFDSAASPFLYGSSVYSTVMELAGAERVLFGTDFPLLSYQRALKQVEQANLPVDARDRLMASNARSLLAL